MVHRVHSCHAVMIGTRVAPTLAWVVTLLGVMVGGCEQEAARFPDRAPLWVDEDTRPFRGPPPERYSSFLWDGADNAVFRPLTEAWRFERASEAVNVNALDEVPSSSWYENRLARRLMSPEDVARGACQRLEAPPLPWRVVSGKPDGASPGFTIEDADGQRHMLKPDGALQPERASAADAIAASIWHAAGFHAPCNRVVYVDPASLELAEGATTEHADGREEPLTDAHVQRVLAQAVRRGDGTVRLAASQFIDGAPVGHWRYDGVRREDPNDVVPHEHRRELRAQYVLSAWTNHIDSRQENTMAAWMTQGESHGYLRHYVIDFGDCFGVIHESEALSKRFGHSGYFDVQHLATDLVTLGQLDRPWDHAAYGPAGETLGYYDVARFEPDAWRPGYPNPAYDRMTERDAAWMARVVARFRDPHIRALVERGRFSDPTVSEELIRVLIGRRDRILERWLTRLSPLTWPRVEDDQLCVQDLAVWTGIRDHDDRRYEARAADASGAAVRLPGSPTTTDDAFVCQPLPDRAGYLVVELIAETVDRERTAPARVHLLRDDEGATRLLGLERVEESGS